MDQGALLRLLRRWLVRSVLWSKLPQDPRNSHELQRFPRLPPRLHLIRTRQQSMCGLPATSRLRPTSDPAWTAARLWWTRHYAEAPPYRGGPPLNEPAQTRLEILCQRHYQRELVTERERGREKSSIQWERARTRLLRRLCWLRHRGLCLTGRHRFAGAHHRVDRCLRALTPLQRCSATEQPRSGGNRHQCAPRLNALCA